MYDLNWLGLTGWEKPLRQSERMETYRNALKKLIEMDLLYKCECTRRDITNALEYQLSVTNAKIPKSLTYPGTCKEKRILHKNYSHINHLQNVPFGIVFGKI